MKLKKTEKKAANPWDDAESLMERTSSLLAPGRVNLKRVEEARGNAAQAMEALEEAAGQAGNNSSAAIIARSAKSVMARARDRLERVHEELESAYLDNTIEKDPEAVKKTLQEAAREALAETRQATKLTEEAGQSLQGRELLPAAVRAALGNRTAVLAGVTALTVAGGLAAFDTRAFSIALLIGSMIGHQAAMLTAMVRCAAGLTRRTMDAHAVLATICTVLIAGSMMGMGAAPRLSLYTTGGFLVLMLVEWAAVRFAAPEENPAREGGRK